jgi:acyl-CoA synthetase (AMP-forming)/AMP-acid ligase II
MRTLVDVLEGLAGRHPDEPVWTFVREGHEAIRCTRGALWHDVAELSARLQARTAPGDRVLLVHPPGPAFSVGLLACLHAGVVAVPLPPLLRAHHADRLSRIARNCSPAMVLGPAPAADLVRDCQDVRAVPWLPVDELHHHPPAPPRRTDLALLQYTSGSTGGPKGVSIGHDNLAANVMAIAEAFRLSPEDRAVFWLPPYHDMGLIGGVLTGLCARVASWFMTPMAFVRRPLSWLQLVSDTAATISGAPNFAYGLCADRATDDRTATLDLRSWRLAFCGAEPVDAATLGRFAHRFALSGFSAEAFYPCYGLAEATLMVSGPQPGTGCRTEDVDADRLETVQRAVPPAPGRRRRTLVRCGVPLAGHDLVVTHPHTGAPLANGSVGEIWVRGASVARGYWNRPEETARVFGARLEGDLTSRPWLRTGDLGYVHGGEVVITGRLKDVIIVAGRNLDPSDLERTVTTSLDGPAVGRSAAFGLDEGPVVVLEMDRRSSAADLDAARQGVVRALADEHGVTPRQIVLVPIHSIPLTTSGKVRRAELRQRFLDGALADLAEVPA